MATKAIDDAVLQRIADAIREKSGTTAGLDPDDDMPQAILGIKGTEIEEITNEAGGKTVYINSEPEKLPEGFTRLNWIQSDGRQYVNTQLKATTNNFRVTMKFEYTSVAAQQSVFGTTPGGSVRGVCPYTHAAGSTAIYLGTSTQLLPTTVSANEVYEWDIAAENGLLTWWQNGEMKTATYSGVPDQTLNYFLLANNNNGTPNRFCSAKIYFAQAYINGTISRNYIPCLNASGEAGLWDSVTQEFFGDAAGVGFIAGPVVTPGVSKVVLEDEVLIDLTGATIGPETVLAGFIGHDKTGAQFVGELVQKAGGRPFASGSFTLAAASSSYTVSGLSFKPSIVFVIWDQQNLLMSRTVAALYQDTEKGVGKCVMGMYDDYYGEDIFYFYTGTHVTMNGDGFTCQVLSYEYMIKTYHWVAIGAEG